MAAKKGIAILRISGTKDEFVKEAGSVAFASGLFKTAGGDATETITVTGASVGDSALVTVNTVGSTPRTVTTAKVTAADTLTVTLSGDPSTDHVLNYVVFKTI